MMEMVCTFFGGSFRVYTIVKIQCQFYFNSVKDVLKQKNNHLGNQIYSLGPRKLQKLY